MNDVIPDLETFKTIAGKKFLLGSVQKHSSTSPLVSLRTATLVPNADIQDATETVELEVTKSKTLITNSSCITDVITTTTSSSSSTDVLPPQINFVVGLTGTRETEVDDEAENDVEKAAMNSSLKSEKENIALISITSHKKTCFGLAGIDSQFDGSLCNEAGSKNNLLNEDDKSQKIQKVVKKKG